MKAKSLPLLQAAVIVLAGWFVFAPAIHGGWLWDDGLEIANNPILRDRAGLWKIWFAPSGIDYLPLKTTAQWVQWHLWGARTAGYHLTNIALHLLSALLLWRLLGKLGVRFAWLGGLLFAIHPLAVESVAWIAEFKNVLSLALLLLAMIAFVAYDERKAEVGRRKAEGRPQTEAKPQTSGGFPTSAFRLPTSAFVFFLAAMLCKSSVVMFPVILLLYAWWKRGRIGRRDLLASAPFFAVSLALGVVTIVFQNHRAISGFGVPLGGSFSRLAGAGLAVAFYFCKCVFPMGMLPIYPRWTVSPPSLAQFVPWFAIAGIVLWLVRQLRSGRSWPRHVLFGLGFFLINLAPVLGFIPMAYLRISSVADHFAYLPLVGVVGLAAAGISESRKAEGGSRKLLPPSAFLLPPFIVLCALLALESRQYAGIFKNEQTLWSYTVQRNPQAWLGYNNLGNAMQAMGNRREAIADFQEALRLSPGFAEAHNNLGAALAEEGRTTEAASHYREAIRLSPDSADAYNNLGNLLLKAGRPAEAQPLFEKALQLNPDHPEANNNLGDLLLGAGRSDEAIAHFEQALRFKPDFPEAESNLGAALAAKGRMPEAISHYEAALKLNPNFAAAHYNLGLALRAEGRTTEAAAQFKEAK